MMQPAAPPAPPSAPDVDALIRANLPLVQHILHSVAAHFPRHADLDELAQAGALGLVEAAHRYDASRGVPFENWAALRIRGAMLDAVRSLDAASRAVRATSRRVEDARAELAQRLGRMPTDEEVATRLGLPPGAVAELRRKVHDALVLSLDARTAAEPDGDGISCLADTLADRQILDPVEQVQAAELHAFTRDALRALPDRLRDVLEGYFFHGESSEDIAARLGVTVSRVSQMRTQALGLIRAAVTAQFDDTAAPAANPGVAERRRQAYVAAVAGRSTYRSRLADVASRSFTVPVEQLYRSG